MNADQLLKIMPYARQRVGSFIGPLTMAMGEYEINTAERRASFIAQIGHESGQLRYVRELASGAAYEGRKDLGNVVAGDGVRYKGRGLIQITGRGNYKECGRALGLDLISHPELLETPLNACRSAAWFWQSRGLNELADEGNQRAITKRINGGYNGLEDRLALFSMAERVLV